MAVLGGPLPTAILESHDPTTPETFSLSQNYPNLFNPETTIYFDLPQSQEIELSIYNLAAQKAGASPSRLIAMATMIRPESVPLSSSSR